MTCFHPVPHYLKEDGKVTSLPPGDKRPPDFMFPCGLCNGCRIAYSKEYGIRMMHELHETPGELGLFLTLTYRQKTIPKGHNLNYADMKHFIKRLTEQYRYWCTKNDREYIPLRYFYVGEYGGETSRPHYHMILFGLDLPEMTRDQNDTYNHKSTNRGHQVYQSRLIEKAWRLGNVWVGDVSYGSCMYTAAYMFKDKQSDYGNKKLKIYKNVNPFTGEVTTKVKPRAFASNRPGIGKAWIEKYCVETFQHGFIILKDQKIQPPRYYREYCKKYYPDLYEQYKQKVAAKFDTPEAQYNQTEERLEVREICLDANLNKNRLPGDVYKDTGEADTYLADYGEEVELIIAYDSEDMGNIDNE